MWIRTALLALAFLLPTAPAWAQERVGTVFLGTLFRNDWPEVFDPTFADPDKPGFLGFGVAQELGRVGILSFAVEGQSVIHAGRQEVLELNLPLFARLNFDAKYFSSFAFGIGPGYAAPKPPFEIDRNSDTENLLVHWTMEWAFPGPWEDGSDLVLRIHHRSTGYETVADKGGSNGVAIGRRFAF
ncbi:MAG: hypothetical protein AAGJ96_03235 [Pseudomonadota bacterium]